MLYTHSIKYNVRDNTDAVSTNNIVNTLFNKIPYHKAKNTINTFIVVYLQMFGLNNNRLHKSRI